jgi:hypothetical protein
MNMPLRLSLENKVENKVENNIDFKNKDLAYYSKAIPYVIEKAIFNAPAEVAERLKSLLKPETIALLAIIGAGLANPVTGPAVAGGLAVLGFADLVNSLNTLVRGVADARSFKDLDNAAKVGSQLIIDAATKAAGAAIGILRHSKKIINAIRQTNPEMARKLQKIIDKSPEIPEKRLNPPQLIRKNDLEAIKNTRNPKIINEIIKTVVKEDLSKIPKNQQDAFLIALLNNVRDGDISRIASTLIGKAIDKLFNGNKTGGGPLLTLNQLLTEPSLETGLGRSIEFLLKKGNRNEIKQTYETLHELSKFLHENRLSGTPKGFGLDNDLYKIVNLMLHKLSGKKFDINITKSTQYPPNAQPGERMMVIPGKPVPPWNDDWYSTKK